MLPEFVEIDEEDEDDTIGEEEEEDYIGEEEEEEEEAVDEEEDYGEEEEEEYTIGQETIEDDEKGEEGKQVAIKLALKNDEHFNKFVDKKQGRNMEEDDDKLKKINSNRNRNVMSSINDSFQKRKSNTSKFY